MTTTLKAAINRLSRLPKRDQEFYARQLLRELDSDERWNELFDHTTDQQWTQMVEGAKQDAAENGTLSLDDLKASLRPSTSRRTTQSGFGNCPATHRNGP